MANAPNNLDKLFKEKLNQHQIKPSQLAWERLENQLPKKKKEPKTYWWAAAAAVLLFGVSYFIFQNSDQTETGDFVAEQSKPSVEEIIKNPVTETRDNEVSNSETFEEAPKTPELEDKPLPEETQRSEVVNKPMEFVAVNTPKEEEEKTKKVIEETPEIMEETGVMTFEVSRPLIAEVPLELTEIETEDVPEVTSPNENTGYKLTIISDGIKDTPNNNLIAGIGKRVNQVEGLLGKAGQGFGELQEKKNDFFNNLISKKNKETENP